MSKRFSSRPPSANNQQKSLKSASTALSQQITEITQRIEELAQGGEEAAHEYCSQLANAIAKLQLYSNRLLAGRVEEASRMLEVIGNELEEITQRVIASLGTQDLPALKVGESTKLHDHTAATLSLAIDEGLRLYAELADTYQAVKALRRSVFNAATTWSLDDSGVLAAQLDWFANSQTGFNARASRYLIGGGTQVNTEAENLAQEAKEHLRAIDEYIDQAKARHQATRQEAANTLEKQVRFEEIIAKLEKIRQTTTGLPADVVVEILDQSELLNQQERRDWQKYETHPDFHNLHRAKVTISDWLEGIRRLLDVAPKLDRQGLLVLETARRYIEQLEDTSKHANLPPVETKKAAIEPPTPPSHQGRVDRLDEIYQLVIAVAAHQYCSHYYLVGMTINSVLSILVLLGKISEEESRLYRETLVQRLASRSITVKDRSKVTEAWNTANPQVYDWIYFQPGRVWQWRLVARAKQPGLWIGEQLGIDKKAVDAAYRVHKENQLQRHRERRQGKGR